MGKSSLERQEGQVATLYLGLQPAGGAAAQTRLWSGQGLAGGGAVGPVPRTSPDSLRPSSLFVTHSYPQSGFSVPLASHLPSPPALPGACNEVQTMELPSSSLNSLESLEPPLRPGVFPTQTAQLLSTLWGGGPSPDAYLVGNQQAWLALRQHQHPRWHLSFLSCLGTSSES